MSKDELKKLTVQVSQECWKKLKIFSIEKDISLSEHIKNVLEKSVASKKFSNEETNS